MAGLASPRESPTIPSRGRPRYLHSPSPPPQSKKDKRFSMLHKKLEDMVSSFSYQHQDHYFAQLTAIQCDMNLIMRADPHNHGPLDDIPEAVRNLVQEARAELERERRPRERPLSEEAERSFASMGGRMYGGFVTEVNAAIEERDRDLTMLNDAYEDGLAELRRTHQYKMQLAQEEHALLSKTLRDRMIQSVTSRRAKLMRDKEQLDIADSSALLLNPNQFSLGNPASPGGAHPRKTRHTRKADQDELGTAAVENGKKRSRKAAFEDTENDSTGPSSKLENGFYPHREARARMQYSQFEAPLYSVERLFTEKDLAMNITKAHKATFAHFSRVRAQNGQQAAAPASLQIKDGEDSKMEDGEETDASAAAAALASLEAGDEGDAFSPTPSLFFYLPQKSKQSYHATRSQRSTGLDLLSSAAAVNPVPHFVANIPVVGKGNPAAPPPSSLEDAYTSEDFDLMKLEANDNDTDVLRQRCLDKTSVLSLGVGVEDGNGDIKHKSNGEAKSNGDATAASSVPMTRQASGNGARRNGDG